MSSCSGLLRNGDLWQLFNVIDKFFKKETLTETGGGRPDARFRARPARGIRFLPLSRTAKDKDDGKRGSYFEKYHGINPDLLQPPEKTGEHQKKSHKDSIRLSFTLNFVRVFTMGDGHGIQRIYLQRIF